MMGGEIKSWADEVEKEEEEATAAATQQRQKPDPFGSARPGEVTPQENGINWRKLDANLKKRSGIRYESKNGRLHKGSNFPSGGLKQKLLEGTDGGLRRVQMSAVVLGPRNQIPSMSIPPLRYPPKFVAGFLYDDWESKSLSGSDSNREKENSLHELEGRNFHKAGMKSAVGSNERIQSESGQAEQAQCKDRKVKKTAAREKRVDADSTLASEMFHGRKFISLPLENQDKRRQ